MAPEPYRHTYRVERRTRDLTDAERALVDARLHEWEARSRRAARGSAFETLFPLVVAVLVIIFGAYRGRGPVLFSGGLMALLFGLFFVVARRRAKARLASLGSPAHRGPWHPPPGGYRAVETRIFARSVVGAVSGDEDYACWLLFEIPGGDWFYLDPSVLPGDRARAEVHLVRLAPHGPYLAAETRGDAIPRHGASEHSDDYAKAMEDEHIWCPSETPDGEEQDADERVAEAALPAWVRAAAAG